jgi:hypothetical protein
VRQGRTAAFAPGQAGRSNAVPLRRTKNTFGGTSLQRGEVGVEVGYGFDTAEIIFQGKMLVGGVGVFVW